MHQVTGSGLTGKKRVLIPDKSIMRDYKEMFQGLFFQYNRGWLFCNAKDDTHRGTAGVVGG